MTDISPSKPTGLLKLAFLLPRYLYRWHLGWLLGHLCLMITHIGRKTGQRRQTVLEIIHYDPSTQECIVMAAWGAQSDWYRNIQIQPAVEVQVGRLHYRPQQRLLSSEETLAILQEYPRCHPFRARFLLPLLMSLVGVAYERAHQKECMLSARSCEGWHGVHKSGKRDLQETRRVGGKYVSPSECE